jgi:tetratricopeptide (TPR) repeat protein
MNDQRIAQLKLLQASDPSDPFLPYAIAQEYMAGANWEAAITQFEALTNNFPEYLPAYYHFGLALLQANNVEKSITILRQGMALAKTQRDGKTANEIEALLEELE